VSENEASFGSPSKKRLLFSVTSVISMVFSAATANVALEPMAG
jgi:hypothetical protein